MDPTFLLLSLFLGLIGMAMFGYGRREQRITCLVAGLLLMVVPYFIPSTLALVIVGALLTAAPFFLVF